MSRPAWDEYFMEVTKVVATRSTCLRRQLGAVIVKDKRILTTGYNGAPSGLAHCLDVGCLRQEKGIPSGERFEFCRGLHAEQNAIIQAASYGVSIRGAAIYTSCYPCVTCAKMIVNAGITRIVYADDYPDELSREVLAEAGIAVEHFERERDDGDKTDRPAQT
ncbi:MAG: deoxycytidylate deaminase [bacterium]|jgi:dCMP deaminase